MKLSRKLKSFLEFDQGRMDPTQFPIHELDIPYYENLKLDVYMPDHSSYKKPTIIILHGGGWISGFKQSQFMRGLVQVVEYGVNVVSIDYSLSIDARYPRQIIDIKEALQWVEKNAERYHFNLEHLHLWGESAGAHLALLGGLIQEEMIMGFSLPKTKHKVKSIIAFYPSIDSTTIPMQLDELGCSFTNETNINDEDGLMSLLVGKENFNDQKVMSAANPTTFITNSMPRILLQHGKKDTLVPAQQSIDFYNKVKEKFTDANITLELFETAVHTDDQFFTSENIQRVVDFINE